MPCILIGIPAHGGNIKDDCVHSLFKLQSALTHSDIELALLTFKSANIFLSRNFFGSVILSDERFSHLLFIDADMVFEPSSVMKMLGCNVPFANCACPKRTMKPDIIVDSLAVSLLRRDVFARIHRTDILREYKSHGLEAFGLKAPLYGFFDSIDGKSEDYSFVQRWHDLGGEITTLKNEPIGHIGDFTYRAQ